MQHYLNEVEKNCLWNISEKTLTKCRNCLNLHGPNHFHPCNITSKNWQINVRSKESSLKRLKRSIRFQNFKILIIIRETFIKKNMATDAKFVFRNCLFVIMADIYELWIFCFSKHVDLVLNLTRIDFFFKVRNFSKCVVTMLIVINVVFIVQKLLSSLFISMK